MKVLFQNGECECCSVSQLDSTSFAASKGHVEVVKVLLKNGPDVNAVNKTKSTLNLAAQYRQTVAFFNYLLRC